MSRERDFLRRLKDAATPLPGSLNEPAPVYVPGRIVAELDKVLASTEMDLLAFAASHARLQAALRRTLSWCDGPEHVCKEADAALDEASRIQILHD